MTDPATDIQQTKQAYREAILAHARALQARQRAKAHLERSVAHARYEQQLEGKNEGDREAHARELFADLYAAVEDAEIEVLAARAELDAAFLDYQTARDLASLAAGFPLERAA